ncbi:HET-domain-containing protein [Cenococcum geophilum]
MRLLRLEDNGEFSLVEFVGKDIPPYAILSHTWGADGEEVTFKDLVDDAGKSKAGYSKICFCGKQAADDGLQFFWVDTCCIDKLSYAELTEAINVMFRWYQDAARCYVYLSDVSFKRSRWFTRGWTLQELIAPTLVEFFSKEGKQLGNKQLLEQTLCEITGIAIQALRGSPLSYFKDEAYSLLGIFDIHMPLIYGEGRKNALNRLQKEMKESPKDEQKRMLLDSLRFNQIDERWMTIKKAHAKTCKWLLEKSEYLDWLNATKLGEHYGFLWIKGKPGTGKLTLMKFALANARKMMTDRIVISFFFNARGMGLKKSTIGIISTYHQWSVKLLKMLLGESSVEHQIRDIISFFEYISELTISAGIRFQVCFLSRHYPHITVRKGLDLDITNYLDSELKVSYELQERAFRVFIWVILMVQILNKEHDHGRIYMPRQKLREIPGDIHELFHNILIRDSHNRDELVFCIQWLYFAIISGVKPKALLGDTIERFILNSSKGLVEITTYKTRKVKFIHKSKQPPRSKS